MKVDKSLIIKRFSRAIESYDTEATAQIEIIDTLMSKLTAHYTASETKPEIVVEIGCGTGLLSRRLAAELKPKRLILNDLCDEMRGPLSDLLQNPAVRFIAQDAETLELPTNCDLIISTSTLQWLENPNKFLEKCAAALAPNGILAITTFGEDNLLEISALTGQKLKYAEPKIPQTLTKIYAGKSKIILEFDTPQQALKHLKKTGVNALQKTVWTKTELQKFCEKYTRKFQTHNQKITLTYDPLTIIAQKL